MNGNQTYEKSWDRLSDTEKATIREKFKKTATDVNSPLNGNKKTGLRGKIVKANETIAESVKISLYDTDVRY